MGKERRGSAPDPARVMITLDPHSVIEPSGLHDCVRIRKNSPLFVKLVPFLANACTQHQQQTAF